MRMGIGTNHPWNVATGFSHPSPTLLVFSPQDYMMSFQTRFIDQFWSHSWRANTNMKVCRGLWCEKVPGWFVGLNSPKSIGDDHNPFSLGILFLTRQYFI